MNKLSLFAVLGISASIVACASIALIARGTPVRAADPAVALPLDVPITIPLDEPVTLAPAPDQGPFGLLRRPSGVYLYRTSDGRTLATLPDLAGGAVENELSGIPLGFSLQTPSLPPGVDVLPGWPVYLPADPSGPAALGDLNDDGWPEIVLTLADGAVHVLDSSGLELPGWPLFLEDDVHDGATLTDVDGDGRPEILVTTAAGLVHAFDATGGSEPTGWPLCLETLLPGEQLSGAPLVTRLHAEGSARVVVVGTQGTVQVFGTNGRPDPGWPVRYPPAREPPNPAASYVAPVAVDLNGDDTIEIVAAFNSGLVTATQAGGRPVPGWPRELPGRARAGFGRPAAADLDGDGVPEIVVATDRGFPGPPQLCVYGPGGEMRSGWPVALPETVNGGVAIADLEPHPGLEIVVAGIGGDGEIAVYREDGTLSPGWPRRFAGSSFDLGLVVADLDGNPGFEIAALGSHAGYEEAAKLYVMDAGGATLEGFPIVLQGCDAFAGGLTAGDLDLDGNLDLVIAVGGDPRLTVVRFPARYSRASVPWARSGRGPLRTPIAPGGGMASETPPPEEPASRPDSDRERLPSPESLPAPLDPKSTLTFLLEKAGHVKLDVLGVRGEHVRTVLEGTMPKGLYAIAWDGLDVDDELQPSGVYFFQLEVDGEFRTRQLLMLLR